MNKLCWFFLTILLVFSCSEVDDLEPEIDRGINAGLVCIDEVCIDAEWTWIESYGSIAGSTITPSTEMLTRKLIITEDSYQEYENDVLLLETNYEFVKSDELSTFTTDSLVLKLETGNWLAVQSEDDNLVIIEPCFDCWRHTYKIAQ